MYREEGDQVVLTMSRADYDRLLILLGASIVHATHGGKSLFTLDQIIGLLNRMNEGNPHFAPYQVEEKKS